MASEPRLTVELTPLALRHLDRIWDWNAEAYGLDRTEGYVALLREEAERLGANYGSGKPVPTRPEYRYVAIRRGRKGHGRVVVYSVVGLSVKVLAFCHTAQDWQGHVERDEI